MTRLVSQKPAYTGCKLPPLRIGIYAVGGHLVRTIDVPDPREGIIALFNASAAYGIVAVPMLDNPEGKRERRLRRRDWRILKRVLRRLEGGQQ
jgi:hypothetical protein